MSEWISVMDGMPAPMQHVLVHYSYNDYMGVSHAALRGGFIDDGGAFGVVTHWMPLPEPPREEKE